MRTAEELRPEYRHGLSLPRHDSGHKVVFDNLLIRGPALAYLGLLASSIPNNRANNVAFLPRGRFSCGLFVPEWP